MCDFFSFVLADKGEGTTVYTAPSLTDHSEIISLCELTNAVRLYECEWTDDDNIIVRIGDCESQSVVEFYQDWIRSRWSSRQELVNQQIMEHLQASRMPSTQYLVHPNWNDRTMRLFACDCAERVLPIFEKKCPDDLRPRQAIEVSRHFANGEATSEELAAACDAAWDAARYAAWGAARGAAWDAARVAARDAVWYAAWDAETSWQTQRIMQYLNGELN